jgi:hypothetical protein
VCAGFSRAVDRPSAVEDAKGDAVIDIEATLREYLEQRAGAIEVHPDVDAVLDGGVSVALSPSHARPSRWSILAVAAAIVVALAAGMLVVDLVRRPNMSDRPNGQLPANGAIVVSNGNGTIVYDPDRAESPSQSPGAFAGEWSRDGERLAYISRFDVSVFDVATGLSNHVGRCGTAEFEVYPCSLAWSPDGRTLATTAKNAIQLFDATAPSADPLATLEVEGEPRNLNWTSDNRLVFTLYTTNGFTTTVESMAPDGSRRATLAGPNSAAGLFSYRSLVLSPNGRTLAWIDSAAGELGDQRTAVLELMMMDVDESTPTMIREVGQCFCTSAAPVMTWSPDGTQLALVLVGTGLSERPQGISDTGLYVIDQDGTHGRYLGPASGQPVWAPRSPHQ